MSRYAVDCPTCDANKTNPRALRAHYRAIAHAIDASDVIAEKIEEAQWRKHGED